MDKKDLFDAFDDFSQNLLVGLSEIETMKNKSKNYWRRILFYVLKMVNFVSV